MTKSNIGDPQAVTVLGAALALGMSLGMVGAASAEPQNKSGDVPKLDAASKDAAKMSGTVTQKGQQTIKLSGSTTIKGQETLKMTTHTVKIDASATQKVSGDTH